MSLTPCDLLLRRCRWQDEEVDIAIGDGRITAIAPNLTETAQLELDAGGKLVSPPFVESHIHLDSALTPGEPRWNQSGTLDEGLEIWGELRQSLSVEDVKKRALETLKLQASQGVLFVRTHADVSESSLIALLGLLEVRELVKDWITLEVVAFPQDGVYGNPKHEELLEEALKLGADAVGGLPNYEFTREDGVKSVHRIFELAEKYDRLIDIHCDESGDEQSRFLEVVAACAVRSGMGSKVTASHAVSLGHYNNAYVQKLMGFLVRSQINFVANPFSSITMQGRTSTYPKPRGVTRVKELWQAGLNVSLGTDAIQDSCYSLGTGNMLDVAHMALHICQMTGMSEIDACFDMVTTHGAKTLHLENNYGIEVGKPANLIVLDADSRYDAIRRRSTVTHVISQGKLLVRTEPPVTKWNFDLLVSLD
jgi:cytosine/creatinine deaminase